MVPSAGHAEEPRPKPRPVVQSGYLFERRQQRLLEHILGRRRRIWRTQKPAIAGCIVVMRSQELNLVRDVRDSVWWRVAG
ncbi:MAG: hypothetical protein ACI9W4_002551 [Rhodothermales bacterium]|jgi:hypothetical protein